MFFTKLNPLKITLIYAIVGVLWILLSDRLVMIFSGDLKILSCLQTLKGWFYVAATAVMLFYIIRFHSNKQIQALETLSQEKNKLDKLSKDLEVLLKISKEVTATQKLKELYRKITTVSKEVLHLDFSTLMLLSTDKKYLTVQDTIGFPDSMIGTFSLMEGQGLSTYVVKNRKLEIVTDFENETRFEVPPIIFEKNIKSAICAPMIIGDDVFGAIIGHTLDRRMFTEDDIRLYQGIANIAAVAIRNAFNLEIIGKISHAIEQSPVSVVITDINGNIEYVNPKFMEVTGYCYEEIIGQNPRILKSGETSLEEYKQLWDTITSGKTWKGVFRNKRKNGELFWESAIISPITNSEGVITNFIGVKEDITGVKMLEYQLLQAQKMEAIGQLAGGIAHDFNNILTAIIGYASLLKMNMQKDSALIPYIEHILRASERATNLTQGLLAFSRRQDSNLKPVDINGIIKEIEKFLTRLIREDIEFKIMLFDSELVVMADVEQIEHVLMNLVTNAVDAMPFGGELTIKTEFAKVSNEFINDRNSMAGEYAHISVADTGVGIDEKIKSRIFEPFFTTKEVGKGTGLGLAIVYGIIKQHNGFIDVHSELGRGTTFHIYLPIVKAKKTIETSIVEELPLLSNAGTETVLIAEDDIVVRELTKKVLEGAGYKVIEAVDGEDALKLFNENSGKIHLLLLDVIMPRKNGKEVYEEIIKIKPNIKVIFISGYTADIIQKKAIIDNGLDFISKPVSPSEILRKVREVLDR